MIFVERDVQCWRLRPLWWLSLSKWVVE